MDFVLFIIGLAAIIKGADWLTDGAASIARHFGIPTIVVGLTIVAMGSSAPELVVSVMSAIEGNVDMALGNVVGSNIFNILAIMGITAMVSPVIVDRSNVLYDVPFLILSSVCLAIAAFDTFINGSNATNSISRTDGLLLLCIFSIFMSYTMAIARNNKHKEPVGNANADKEVTSVGNAADSSVESNEEATMKPQKAVLFCIVGLAFLIAGGDMLVDGASGIASSLGVSQSIIALTIVSSGTSAPELAASVMAARKGDTAMALGNVVGSVVFNVFFVLGCAATVCPLGIGGVSVTDIVVLLVASITLWAFCKFGNTFYTITRIEGTVMVLMAIAYYAYLILNI